MDSLTPYPTFDLNGTTYTVKFTLGTLRRMKIAGVDLSDYVKAFKDIDVIATCAVKSFYGPDGELINMTADEFADNLRMGRFAELNRVLFGGIEKAAPSADQAQAPAAPAPSGESIQ